MKKVLAILLSTILVLSLTACGASRDDMLNNAIELNWKEVYDEYLANEARATEEYDGKIVKWTATVYEIDTKYITMASETYCGLPSNTIRVYLDKEEIVQLDKYKEITVVGKLNLSSFSTINNAFIVE